VKQGVWPAVGLAVFTFLSAHGARAQQLVDGPPHVALEVAEQCLGASGARVKELVALELSPRMRVVGQGDGLVGEVRCEAPAAVLEVREPERTEPLRVRLDLAAAAPEARERLLALALAELITTSQLEHTPKDPAPAAQPPAQPDEPSQNARAPLFELWVAPSLSLAGAPIASSWGGELGVAHALGPLILAADFQAHFGQNDRAASDVAMRLLSTSALLMVPLIDSGAQLAIGAGLRLGHATLFARSHRASLQAEDLSGVWLGPALRAALSLPLLAPARLRFALESGYLARAVVGLDEQGVDRMALRGAWFVASLGLSFQMK